MKKLFASCFSFLFFVALSAQNNSYGLLKFNIPPTWQQQTREKAISFSGIENESVALVELMVFENVPAGVKPDSSFRMAWQTIMSAYGNPPQPFLKKRTTSNGLQVAINQANPVEIKVKNEKRFIELLVFTVGKQMQAIQIMADSLADFKALRPFIDDFIESVDTIEKEIELPGFVHELSFSSRSNKMTFNHCRLL